MSIIVGSFVGGAISGLTEKVDNNESFSNRVSERTSNMVMGGFYGIGLVVGIPICIIPAAIELISSKRA